MVYRGKYYTHQHSFGIEATVALERFYITITNERTQPIKWNTDNILPLTSLTALPVVLQYSSPDGEKLEVNDVTFVEELKRNYPKANFHQGKRKSKVSSTAAALIILAVAVVAVILLAYFVVLPYASEKAAEQLPLKYEQQLGDAVYSSMVQPNTIDDSSTVLMNAFFARLNYKSDYPIHITVVNDKVVNAFALPGGKIVVHRGIIEKMDDYEELAALLSHEFSHVQQRHTTKNVCRSLSSYLFVSLLLGDAGGLTTLIAENANQIKQLNYSRELEEEADREGMKLMQQHHVDIEGMKHLFEKLKKEEAKAGDSTPAFLRTHPLTQERIKLVEKELAKQRNNSPPPSLDSLFTLIKQKNY